MKQNWLLFALLSAFSLQPLALLAQGSLTPPGAPAPMMKSLDQIEARTAITNSGAVTISQPGSYYLTRNITVNSGDAIDIATNGVTLDLNGFSLFSTAPSATGTAILLNFGGSDISIFNGHIVSGVTNNNGVFAGPGFANGIDFPPNATNNNQLPENVLVRNVTVTGCLVDGINVLGFSTAIDSCAAWSIGGTGLSAGTVSSSRAFYCGNYGVHGVTVVEGCSANSVVPGGYAIYGEIVKDSSGESDASGGSGIYALSQAVNCRGSCLFGGGGNGVYGSIIVNCYGYGAAGSTALHGTIGVASEWNGTGTPEVLTYKYNMP